MPLKKNNPKENNPGTKQVLEILVAMFCTSLLNEQNMSFKKIDAKLMTNVIFCEKKRKRNRGCD